jgi:UDP-glucose:(heptosyl)LPS alpha-1,3-glucosyltransferase
MKIRFATAIQDFSTRRGGAERYLVDLCTRMATEDFEVHVFTEHWDEENPGIHLHRIKSLPFPKSLRFLSFAIKATKAIENGNYDVTLGIGHTLKADILQPRGGVHWAWFWRSLRACDHPVLWMIKFLGRIFSLKQWVSGWIEGAAYRDHRLPYLIAISDMIKQDMIHWYKIPADRITVDYNGVDIERFHPRNRRYREEIRERHAIGDEFVILFVSNNFRMKGLDYLIRALGKIKKEVHRPFKLLILGRDRKDPYVRLAKRMNVSEEIVFVGCTDEPEKYYGCADLLVHPTFYDACSRVVLEAMASGLPVITTTSNGASGLLTQSRMEWVIEDPRDVNVLSEKILLSLNREKEEKEVLSLRKQIEPYSFDRHFSGMVEAINFLMKQKKEAVNELERALSVSQGDSKEIP